MAEILPDFCKGSSGAARCSFADSFKREFSGGIRPWEYRNDFICFEISRSENEKLYTLVHESLKLNFRTCSKMSRKVRGRKSTTISRAIEIDIASLSKVSVHTYLLNAAKSEDVTLTQIKIRSG